jgi:regulator of replication initiation timing
MYRDDHEALLARLTALEPDALAAPELRKRVAKLEAENTALRIEVAKLAAALAKRVAERR